MRALAPLPTVHGPPKHTVKRIDRPKLATCIHQADDGTEVFLVADNHKMGCKGCGRERAHDVYLAIRDEPGGKQWREFAACCRECQTREVLG